MTPSRSHICLNDPLLALDRLLTLGKILACDIFLANSDRIPSHSSSNGNAGNLLFEVQVDESLTDETMLDGGEDVAFLDIVAVDNKS